MRVVHHSLRQSRGPRNAIYVRVLNQRREYDLGYVRACLERSLFGCEPPEHQLDHGDSNPRMAKLLKIAKTKDVPPGQAAAFTIEGQKIALFNVEGTYYAIDDTCAHRGGPLSEGDVQGTKVTCPWHGADFDLKTGAVLS